MKLNTFLLFDAALMFLCLPILMILKGKKNNENLHIETKEWYLSLTKSWISYYDQEEI